MSSSVPPKITPFFFEDNPYEIGQYANTMCAVSHGDFPIKITWEFNGKPLERNYGISVTPIGRRSATLTIDSLSHDHAGNFTCKGVNVAGLAEFTATLEVNG